MKRPQLSISPAELDLFFEELRETLKLYSGPPRFFIAQCRVLTELLLSVLFEDCYGQEPGNIQLDQLIQKLATKKVLSRELVACLKTLQHNGNLAIHRRLRQGELSERTAYKCLLALDEIIDWFFLDLHETELPADLSRCLADYCGDPRHSRTSSSGARRRATPPSLLSSSGLDREGSGSAAERSPRDPSPARPAENPSLSGELLESGIRPAARIDEGVDAADAGLNCAVRYTPTGRVRSGVPFNLIYEATNTGEASVHELRLEAELPPELELLGAAPEPLSSLAPGECGRFIYFVRGYHHGRVNLGEARLEFRRAGGSQSVMIPAKALHITVDFEAKVLGRGDELRLLDARLFESRSGRCELVAITGPPGCGKSLLARRFIEDRGLKVLEARGTAHSGDPYAPVVELLKTLLKSETPGGRAAIVVENLAGCSLRSLLEKEVSLELMLRVCSQLLDIPLPSIETGGALIELSAPLWTERRMDELYSAVADLFIALSRRSLVVVHFDDVQLVHHDMWRLLEYLFEHPRLARCPLLVLLCIGLEGGDERDRQTVGGEEVIRAIGRYRGLLCELRPLKDAVLTQLVTSVLEPSDLPEGFVEQLVAYGRGSPLQLTELLRSLLTLGRLEFADGAWRVAAGVSLRDLESTFSQAVLQCAIALPPQLRAILDAAAVCGTRFQPDLLYELMAGRGLRLERRVFDRALRRLERYHLFLVRRDTGYEFSHDEVQRAIYTFLSENERRSLHADFTALYEDHGAEQYAGELSYHWRAIGDTEKLVDSLELRARRFEEKLAYEAAWRCLEEAIEIAAVRRDLRGQDWRFEVNRRLARLHWLSGNFTRAEEIDVDNIVLGRLLQRLEETVGIYCVLVTSNTWQGRFHRARSFAEQGLELAENHELRDGALKLSIQLAILDRTMGLIGRARERLEEARPRCAELEDPWFEAECDRNLGIVYRMEKDFARSRTCFKRAIKVFETLSPSARAFGLGMTHDNLAALELRQGRLSQAESAMRLSIEHRASAGDRIGESRGNHGLAKILFLKCALSEASAALDRSLELKERIGDEQGIAKSLSLRSEIDFELGYLRLAYKDIQRARDIYRDLDLRREYEHAQLFFARITVLAGRRYESAGRILEKLARADQSRWGTATRLWLAMITLEYRMRIREEVSSEEVRSLTQRIAEIRDRVLANRLSLSLAALNIRRGEAAAAKADLSRLLKDDKVKSHGLHRSRALFLQARALAGLAGPEKAIALADKALAVAQQHGFTYGAKVALDLLLRLLPEKSKRRDQLSRLLQSTESRFRREKAQLASERT